MDSHFAFNRTSILEIIDIISKDLDNGKLPIGLFLDLSKAFYKLDLTILLDKLLYYGIKGTVLAWFKSYVYQTELNLLATMAQTRARYL